MRSDSGRCGAGLAANINLEVQGVQPEVRLGGRDFHKVLKDGEPALPRPQRRASRLHCRCAVPLHASLFLACLIG